MSEFTDSLGIKSGDSVVILDDGNELFRRLSIEAPKDVALQKRVLGEKVEMIIVRIGEKGDKRQLFRRVQQGIKQDGVIWAVTRKSSEGKAEIRDEMLKDANNSGLTDTGRLSFSEEEEGTRFVIRIESRL